MNRLFITVCFAIGLTGPALAAEPMANSLLESRFPDLKGKPQAIAQWKGKPLIINFWASWCGPCRAEMPEFVEQQRKYAGKVQFVGIAFDEPQFVKPFVQSLRINYPILIAPPEAMPLMKQEGNRVGGLPFTVIYNAKGEKVAAEAGLLKKEKLQTYLEGLTSP